ncbi:MAG: hypothetical protein ACQGTM_15840 [bacterium]
MFLIKMILKVLAFPIMLMVTLIQWLGIYLISFSAVFFNLLAGVLFLVSIMTYFMGLDTGKEVLRMLGISFIVFIIPHIGEWIVERIAIANYALRDFIKS